jgi:hypothetical protein
MSYHPLCYYDMSETEYKTFMKITHEHPFIEECDDHSPLEEELKLHNHKPTI